MHLTGLPKIFFQCIDTRGGLAARIFDTTVSLDMESYRGEAAMNVVLTSSSEGGSS